MMFKIGWTGVADAALKQQPPKRRMRIIAIVETIAADPFATQPMIKRLKGTPNSFRYRLGDWRILYRLDTEAGTLRVLDIRPRGRAYE